MLVSAAVRDYLMEDPLEARRLEDKTDAAETERQLALVGLREGMRALDAGAGTGAVARIMARLVGARGAAVAVDRSADRLAFGAEVARREGIENLSFVQGALEQLEQADLGQFDLVWCRFVIEYVACPEHLIRSLIARTRVGGTLVVADIDNALLTHYPLSAELQEGLEKLGPALAGDIDLFVGRKLFHFFRKQPGLGEPKIHILPYNVVAGAIPEAALGNWRQKFAVTRARLLPAFGGEAAFDRFVELFLQQLRSPDTFAYTNLIIAQATRTA